MPHGRRGRAGGFPTPATPLHFKRCQRVRKAFGSKRRVPIADVEVKVWFGGVPGIPNESEYLPLADMVTDLDPDLARLQVRVECESACAQIEDHMVAADGL